MYVKQKYNQDTGSWSQSVPVSFSWSWSQLVTSVGVRVSGRQWALGPQWPTVKQPSQDAKEVLLWSEELGSICSSLSPSPTHLSHTRNINPFKNKVWGVYFYKDVCSFVHWSSSLWYDYGCEYTTQIRRVYTKLC